MPTTSPNMIGPFPFVSLRRLTGGEGPPQTQHQRATILQRAGVDGIALRRDGIGAEPFTMQAGRDNTSAAASQALLRQYKQLENQGSVTLRYNGVNRGRFFVTRVELIGEEGMSAASGGFNGSSARIWQTVEWELVADNESSD